MNIIDNLLQLGFTNNEANIYSHLVNAGPNFAGHIIYETKKHRQVVYNALDNLVIKRLVDVTKKGGKNLYSVANPEVLQENAKQNFAIAEYTTAAIRRKLQEGQETTQTFSGSHSYEEGLADFRNKARVAKEYIVIGGEEQDWYEYTKPFFASHVTELQKLRKLGVDIFILFFEQERLSAEKYIRPYLHNPYVCKVLNASPKLPQTTWLAGNYAYMLTPTTEPLVISIQSKTLAESYRNYFWQCWRQAKKL